ncbi:hypothetical protein ACH5RR_013906 [Cinchona calisaya]|uniref:Uncharacterized protein n=1 Tax=Cinchona calisaya TaxID=153742 RepID=A0ABD3A1H6_9GENT
MYKIGALLQQGPKSNGKPEMLEPNNDIMGMDIEARELNKESQIPKALQVRKVRRLSQSVRAPLKYLNDHQSGIGEAGKRKLNSGSEEADSWGKENDKKAKIVFGQN